MRSRYTHSHFLKAIKSTSGDCKTCKTAENRKSKLFLKHPNLKIEENE